MVGGTGSAGVDGILRGVGAVDGIFRIVTVSVAKGMPGQLLVDGVVAGARSLGHLIERRFARHVDGPVGIVVFGNIRIGPGFGSGGGATGETAPASTPSDDQENECAEVHVNKIKWVRTESY